MAAKLLRFEQVKEMVSLSRSTIWRLERDGYFPKRVQLTENCVAWDADAVQRWIDEKLGKPMEQDSTGSGACE